MIGSALFYRRLASPLHAARAGVGAAWWLALILATLILYHPLALLALTLGVLGAARGAGVGHALARSLRTATIVALPIVLVNVLVSRQGLTVFARLGDLGPFGRGDLTVEAAVYGVVIALKVTLLILVTALAGLAVDPDELLRGLRRLSFRSALTATLATRMLPVLAADAQRLAEAQRTRPNGAAQGARGRVALLGAVIGGSLDRAMDVAATLEVRGYAAGTPARGTGRGAHRPLSRHDVAFAFSAVAVIALALVGRLSGVAAFDSYPQISMRLDAGTLVLSAALVVAVLLPFCDRRGIDR
ncbi:MAG: energy-coupling factor transport system permease protein [Solirubrobacteraceae bacterium]|nr:energy-coupling factor transport system permease protein [Solirubrobacteraceae bacterium]